MPKFFEDDLEENKEIYDIQGENAKHISYALRHKVGDNITLCDKKGNDFDCTIIKFSEKSVQVRIDSVIKNQCEPDIKVSLFQSLLKGDKMEEVIQKSVELGVYEIYPVLTSRCISKPDKNFDKKIERYNKISLEAAKQCGRGIIPKVHNVITYKEMLSKMRKSDTAMILYESEKDIHIKEYLENKNPKSIAVGIGCEGGFSQEEIEKAKEENIESISLGKRILRAQTAPVCALSCIMYESGNL